MDENKIFAKCAWRLLPFIMLLYLVNIFDRANVAFAALTMNADLGFSPVVYGFGAGLFFVGYSLFQVPANLILERVGARRWIFCILLVWGAVAASTAAVQGPTSFYVVRVLLGIAEAGFFPGMMLYMTYWFPRAYRARFVARFMSAAALAFVVGGPLASLILEMDGVAGLRGWQWLFLIEGLPACLLAFAVLIFLPDGPAHASWLTAEEKQTIAARLAAEDTSRHSDFWLALRDPRVLALAIGYLGYNAQAWGVGLWLPQMVQAMGVSNFATGFVVALPYVAAIVVMNLWARSSDSSGERIWHVALPAALTMTGLFVASVTQSAMLVFLTLALVTIIQWCVEAPFWALTSSLFRGTAAAGGLAFVNTIGTGLGAFIGPAVVGVLTEATGGYSAGMAALAIGPMLTAIIVLSLANSIAPRRLALQRKAL